MKRRGAGPRVASDNVKVDKPSKMGAKVRAPRSFQVEISRHMERMDGSRYLKREQEAETRS